MQRRNTTNILLSDIYCPVLRHPISRRGKPAIGCLSWEILKAITSALKPGWMKLSPFLLMIAGQHDYQGHILSCLETPNITFSEASYWIFIIWNPERDHRGFKTRTNETVIIFLVIAGQHDYQGTSKCNKAFEFTVHLTIRKPKWIRHAFKCIIV